ncbi:DNA excision repair protein [Acetobacter orientalis]|uniref:DNA excision repair protein n=1 Tax=Acetobacter orientalis TaxID=146474 RepID=A0A2Z5ZIS5_9PROT|nr:DNA excision repair protein [Acetobacter orientalis]
MPVKAVDFEPTTSTDSVTLAAGDLSYQQIAVRKSLLRGFTAL